MIRQTWKDWLETTGIVGIIASLIFVGLQLRQDENVAFAATFGALTDTTATLAELVLSRSEIWRKGLDGDELSVAELIEFRAIASAVDWYHENQFHGGISLDTANAELVARDYAVALFQHQGLRRYVAERIARYATTDSLFGDTNETGNFYGAVMRNLEALDSLSNPKLPAKMYVFW